MRHPHLHDHMALLGLLQVRCFLVVAAAHNLARCTELTEHESMGLGFCLCCASAAADDGEGWLGFLQSPGNANLRNATS